MAPKAKAGVKAKAKVAAKAKVKGRAKEKAFSKGGRLSMRPEPGSIRAAFRNSSGGTMTSSGFLR